MVKSMSTTVVSSTNALRLITQEKLSEIRRFTREASITWPLRLTQQLSLLHSLDRGTRRLLETSVIRCNEIRSVFLRRTPHLRIWPKVKWLHLCVRWAKLNSNAIRWSLKKENSLKQSTSFKKVPLSSLRILNTQKTTPKSDVNLLSRRLPLLRHTQWCDKRKKSIIDCRRSSLTSKTCLRPTGSQSSR